MSDAFDIPVGTSATEQVTITRDLTVAFRAPGMPEVYATPEMIWLLELASAHAIQPLLPPGWVSVGTEVNVRHLAATPVGLLVRASAKVIAVSGRTVTFAVEAHDGVELIGEGTHTRVLVDRDRFSLRLSKKSAR